VSGWWATKVRQFFRHLFGRVGEAERGDLTKWLTPAQLDLFDSMHRADQRHGLDVVRALRMGGHDDPDVLVAGLLHDCGKGKEVGLWQRVGWSLADHYGGEAGAVRRSLVRLPGSRRAFKTLDNHAQASAAMALAAGCSARCADLIRHQADATDDELGIALRLADEAS
jgi:hypothetical protein